MDRRRSMATSLATLTQIDISQMTTVKSNSWPGNKIGLLTAGDDTQGMNATIRAVARTGFYLGSQVIFIKHGFRGMVEGKGSFEEAKWKATSGIIGVGGTILKSYKSPEFLERSGRLRAAKNLVEQGINNLVTIGGDGTLKGISILHQEWKSLLYELEDRKMVDKALIDKCRHLKVVCILASITNDVCNTDHTIGTVSALQRITESIDAISTTSSSSQLAFVVQVMGQSSGYLALAAGLIFDASMTFIPEWPPVGNWRDELCDKVKDDIRLGSEGILVITCEGSIDRHGRPITPEEVKDTLNTNLNLNAKITVLGHVQRGGDAVAYDRIIGTRMGIEAITSLKDIPAEEGPSVIGFKGSGVMCFPLDEVLGMTYRVEDSIKEKNFTEAVRLRGRSFQNLLNSYNLMSSLRSSVMPCVDMQGVTKIGIVRVGRSSSHHCVVVRHLVAYCHSKNILVIEFTNGFHGLAQNNYRVLCWEAVKIWNQMGNFCLDSAMHTVSEVGLEKAANVLEQLELSGLVLVGNFNAYQSLTDMYEAKEKYRGFCIPMCLVPVSVINNVPGTEISVGADTALNEIINYADKLKRIAQGASKKVFVIETMGHNCGYLATMSAVCVGADAAYIKEEPFTLDTLLNDADHLRNKILHSGVQIGVIMCGEKISQNYNTDFISRVFSEMGKGVYACKASTVGQIQLGGIPSVLDRIRAATAGLKVGEWIFTQLEKHTNQYGQVYTCSFDSKVVQCFNRHVITFMPVGRLVCETDFDERMPTYLPWMKFRPVFRILTKHHEDDLMLDFMSDLQESEVSNYQA